MAGPSPRTWGLRWRGSSGPPSGRSIPTHVGFTPVDREAPGWLPVHPHARGVYCAVFPPGLAPGGPSPRTWGLHDPLGVLGVLFRSIPTHVGFTAETAFVSACCTVHPHARGVYSAALIFLPKGDGPSPRTWGLPLCSLFSHVMIAVHPHARGVYVGTAAEGDIITGPSPRTWGLRRGILRIPPRGRSIPTHVGFTSSQTLAGINTPGPSPRTWGLLLHRAWHRYAVRSIPTHVGFTLK